MEHLDSERSGAPPVPGIADSDSSSLSSGQTSTSEEASDESGSEDSTDSLANMNVFGNLEVGGFEHPLVDFSFDLQATLSENNIPNPMDLLAENSALQG